MPAPKAALPKPQAFAMRELPALRGRRADPLRPERRQWDLVALLAFVRRPAALA